MDSKLREALYVYMNKHGNTLCQWKNNDYEFAQSLPESQQEEIVPELLKAIRQAVGEEMLELTSSLERWIEYNKHDMGELGEFIRTRYAMSGLNELRQKIKSWVGDGDEQ